MHEKIQQLQLAAAVIGLSLAALDLDQLNPENGQLLLSQEPGTADFDHLLEVLLTRIPAEDILYSQPKADYRLELANHWQAINQDKSAFDSLLSRKKTAALKQPRISASAQPALATDLPRPAWLLAEPLALHMQAHRPYYRSPLYLVSQAERIEAGWWQDQVATRDYYIAHDQNYVYYWIFCERPRQQSQDKRWFLHGVFG